jgi:hypothetical protein
VGILYLRADENVLYGGTVATSAGTTDTTYTDDWLVDGRGRPAKATNGTVTWTATGTSGVISLAVVHRHNIDAARTITIAGGVVSMSLAGPAARTNGAPVNPWGRVTEATGAVVSVAVASNSAAVIIGELLAGKVRETTYGLRPGVAWGYRDVGGKVNRRNPSGSVPPLSRGEVARWLRGSVNCAEADKDALVDWFESSRDDSKPSVLIPYSDVQDALVGTLTAIEVRTTIRVTSGPAIYEVQLEFEEWPRKRW